MLDAVTCASREQVCHRVKFVRRFTHFNEIQTLTVMAFPTNDTLQIRVQSETYNENNVWNLLGAKDIPETFPHFLHSFTGLLFASSDRKMGIITYHVDLSSDYFSSFLHFLDANQERNNDLHGKTCASEYISINRLPWRTRLKWRSITERQMSAMSPWQRDQQTAPYTGIWFHYSSCALSQKHEENLAHSVPTINTAKGLWFYIEIPVKPQLDIKSEQFFGLLSPPWSWYRHNVISCYTSYTLFFSECKLHSGH